jgi:hypothetical protein
MTPDDTSDLITAAGGDSAFAKLLGIEHEEGVAQRVNNWKRRGIPSAVELEHYDTIQSLKRQLATQSTA